MTPKTDENIIIDTVDDLVHRLETKCNCPIEVNVSVGFSKPGMVRISCSKCSSPVGEVSLRLWNEYQSLRHEIEVLEAQERHLRK